MKYTFCGKEITNVEEEYCSCKLLPFESSSMEANGTILKIGIWLGGDRGSNRHVKYDFNFKDV